MATLATALRNTLASAFGTEFNSGTIEITTSADAVLATFTLQNPAFGSPSTGAVSLAGVTLSTTASGTGTAAKARFKNSGGTALLTDLTVGTSGTNITIDNTSIASGQTVNLTSFTWTQPASTA